MTATASTKATNPTSGSENNSPSVGNRLTDPTPGSAQEPEFVTMVTKETPLLNHLKLLEDARKAAADADGRDKKEKDHKAKEKARSTISGREVVLGMLVFIESFMDSDRLIKVDDLNKFLESNTKKIRSKTQTKYYRLSKHCSTKDTPASMIHKRACGLEAIIEEGIPSNYLMDAFEEDEAVGPNGAMRRGLQKYVLIYEAAQPSSKTISVSSNKYKSFDEKKLLEEARDFLDALIDIGAPRKTIDALKGFISEKTQVPSEAKAA